MIIQGKPSLDRPRFRPGSAASHLVVALLIVVATALRLTLDSWIAGVPIIAGMPFVTFFPAVVVATLLCGSVAGLAAAVLSLVSAWLFVFPSANVSMAIYQSAVFSVGCITVAAVAAAMRRAAREIRRANEILRVSEGKFRGLLETAPDAMVIVDERHGIALANAQTEYLFGYPRGELSGKPIATLMGEASGEKYRAQLASFMRDAQRAPKGEMVELRGRRRDGSEFPIEVSFGPLRTEAGILVSNAIRDVSARKEIEASLAHASKAKSDFLASVSHELRTPLNAIIGFSEMIRDAVLGPLDARYREYGRDISDSGRHLNDLVNDILDIAKIEGGRLELRDEIVSIADSVEACRRIVAPMAEATAVSLSIEIPAGLPPLRSDAVRFRQILLNLMSNAVKFTPAGGHVSIAASAGTDGAVIVVEDTGIGMRPEDLAIALEPFRQIEGPLSRRFAGTGLGLPLAKALVELHNGTLELESVPDEGTTVRIRLPLERMANAAA